MALQLHEDAFGDPQNALFLATASNLAYEPQEVGGPAFREQLGLEATLYSVGNSQAYVGTNAEHIVVAFRGTESPATLDGLKDLLLNDARNLLIVPSGRLGTDFIAAGVGARMHQGFISGLAEIWESVFERVRAELKASERPLWLTGHSLGGALALLAGRLFLRRFVSGHQIYTFGAPMIGNKDATAAFDRELKGKIFRYVNTEDPVPQLPTVSLLANDFCHCEQEMALGVRGVGSYWAGVAGELTDDLLTGHGLDVVWNFIQNRLGAHLLAQYLESIRSKM
jgi:triacylglycerol lipase